RGRRRFLVVHGIERGRVDALRDYHGAGGGAPGLRGGLREARRCESDEDEQAKPRHRRLLYALLPPRIYRKRRPVNSRNSQVVERYCETVGNASEELRGEGGAGEGGFGAEGVDGGHGHRRRAQGGGADLGAVEVGSAR